MERKKTKRIYLRVSDHELMEIKNRAIKFQSITQYILNAVQSFYDCTIQERLEAKKALAEYYRKYESHLAHIGGNLNQAMRQVNEAAIAGHPTQALILNNLIPKIMECRNVCIELRKELFEVTKNIVRK